MVVQYGKRRDLACQGLPGRGGELNPSRTVHSRTAECTGLFIAVGGQKFEELERANLEKKSENDREG